MKVIDCFPFFNETEVLRLRLDLLWDIVDHFVISEANITHSGLPKEFNFEKFLEINPQYSRKCTVIRVIFEVPVAGFGQIERFDPTHEAWRVERKQREALRSGIDAVMTSDDDLIFVSDVDEIWSPQVIHHNSFDPMGVYGLEQKLHYLYLNLVGVGDRVKRWSAAFCFKANFYRTFISSGKVSLSRLRQGHNSNRFLTASIKSAGWHFSFLGGAEKVIEKISAFSHQEYNVSVINNLANVRKAMRLGVDPLNRGPGYEFAFKHVDSFESEICIQMRRRPHLLKQSLID